MYFHIKGGPNPTHTFGKWTPWEMDPPEHIHGHLLGGSISHGGPFPMQQGPIQEHKIGRLESV